MGFAARRLLGPRAALLDLDEVVIDSQGAWCYALEQAVVAVTGRRIDARLLVDEYRRRPWDHALGVVLEAGDDRTRCARLCREMADRSALKCLGVHDGISMALDRLRASGIEVGAITRDDHRQAVLQLQSTGLDRFVSVLAAAGRGSPWRPSELAGRCLDFIGAPPAMAVFVGADSQDAAEVAGSGVTAVQAAWAALTPDCGRTIGAPRDLYDAVVRAWTEAQASGEFSAGSRRWWQAGQ